MKLYASLLLAAIPTAVFVEADAFVSPSPTLTISHTRQGHAKMPLTPAGRLNESCSSNKQQVLGAPWSKTALEMSGGGGGEAVASEGTATIPDEIFNLVKSIVGAGVLSLPAGTFVL